MNDNTARNLRDVFLNGAHTYLPQKHYCSAIADFSHQIRSISDFLSKANVYCTFNTCKAVLKVKVNKIKKRAHFISTNDGVIVIGRINNQITGFAHGNPIIYVCYFSNDKSENIARFVSLPKGKTIKVIYSVDNCIHNINVESKTKWQRIHFDEGFIDTVVKEKTGIRQYKADSKKLPNISTGDNRHSVHFTTDEDRQLEQASSCLPSEHNFIFYRGQLCLI